MKGFVIDSGGRGQAFVQKMAESPHIDGLFVTGNNPGSEGFAENTGIDVLDIGAQLDFVARNRNIGLIAITADNPLEMGAVDAFQEEFKGRELYVFGPTRSAAEIEWSKLTGKTCMVDSGIPTASYGAFSSLDSALAYSESKGVFPQYIKQDHLAFGKGVSEADSLKEVYAVLQRLRYTGKLSVRQMVIIEEGLLGPELSLQAWCDGENYRMIPFAMRDHKTIYDDDQGPMTGGMGVVTIPSSHISPDDIERMGEVFVAPVLKWLNQRGTPFRGMLFPGVRAGRCLEYNARPGDPEAQAWLARLKSDVVELMIASSTGQLNTLKRTEWDKNESVSMVLAADGYPDTPVLNDEIEGLEEIDKLASAGVKVLHAGTKKDNGKIVVNGGRVLNVVVTGQGGESLRSVCDRAKYASMLINFVGKQFRGDLGKTVINGEYIDYLSKNAI